MRLLVDVDPLPATKNEALAGRVYREKCHKLRHFPSRRHPPRHLPRALDHSLKGRKTGKNLELFGQVAEIHQPAQYAYLYTIAYTWRPRESGKPARLWKLPIANPGPALQCPTSNV